MLSRVADALYWMSRYIERAEDITRMLSVNFDAMLGSGLEDEQLGWDWSVPARIGRPSSAASRMPRPPRPPSSCSGIRTT